MRAPIQDIRLSNLLSYVSLSCGVAAVAAAGLGKRHLVGVLLAAAALSDTFDGRFARSFRRTPAEAAAGAQVDNLVDACVFGMAPIAAFAALLPPPPGLGAALWWAAAVAYLLAVVTRLAFFHVAEEPRSFVGVPSPVLGLAWSSLLLGSPGPRVIGIAFFIAALAATLPIPIPRPRGAFLLLFACWPVALVVAHLLAG